MRISRFTFSIALIATVLVVIIVALSLLLYTNGPRARLVTFDRDPSSASLHRNMTMTIVFDRPIDQRDYTDHISFTPRIDFSAQTARQSITVTFHKNLLHSTDYRLQIDNEVYDQSGRQMKRPYHYSFSTEVPSYVYLERNYGQEDYDFLEVGIDDHIKHARLGEEPEILYSHPEIVLFAANEKYLVVVTRGETRDQLHTLDLQSGEMRQELLVTSGRVSNLVVSPRGETALFRVTPDINTVTSVYFEQYSDIVESLNLETGVARSLTDSKGEFIKAQSIQLDQAGQVALIQDLTQTFYAVSPFNDYDPIVIGSHERSYGFNDDTSEIVFLDNESYSLYDVATSGKRPLMFDAFSFVRSIDSSSSGIYYSSLNYADSLPISTLEQRASWNDDATEEMWTNSSRRFEILWDFEPSYDGSLFALQLNPERCRFDSMGSNSQCTSTHTVIYDRNTAQEITDFPGFDVVWLP